MSRFIVIVASSMIILSACNNTPKSGGSKAGAVKLYPIARDTVNATSIYLKLLDKTAGDSSISYQVKGLYGKDTVGFTLQINKTIPAGINKDGSPNDKDGFKRGVIKFKRSGTESDRFVSALAKLWHAKDSGKMRSDQVIPLVFSSNNNAVDVSKPATYSFKLFFDKGVQPPGEIFFTFDTYKKEIEFQEKDAQQRLSIVQAFME
ncbi:hypothetical protein SAMN05216436_10678 [bacterium A37T11]|nr:hypothetical protein SAMN05216436_10678 [bacterium A37T11]